MTGGLAADGVKFYEVGGAVRDDLLRREGFDVAIGDRDWVVTGATPEWMFDHGFISVGADFPVFLHPKTHEEYALARTERKTARGYHGFKFYTSPDVTLEDDLRRRDLTINAIARDADGTLIDPWHGEDDLKARVLRHVSPAFAEDPVRILRLARFAARFSEFRVAPETMALCSRMVASGEADALVAERVWKELSRGLCEKAPVRMIEVLEDCGYWNRALSAVTVDSQKREALAHAAESGASLEVRTALLFAGVKGAEGSVKSILEALRAPAQCISLADLYERQRDNLAVARTPEDCAKVFKACDVLRRPDRFSELLAAQQLAHPDFDAQGVEKLAQAWSAVDAGAVARAQKDPRTIAQAVDAARLEALKAAEKSSK